MPCSGQSSVAVPIVLVAFATVISIGFVRVLRVTAKLDRQSHTVCSYLRSDADTRRQQSVNSARAIRSEQTFIADSRTLAGLFRKQSRKPASSASLQPLLAYLDAEATVWTQAEKASSKNKVLSVELASRSHGLAAQLGCQ